MVQKFNYMTLMLDFGRK